jgi:hypothetical protein
VAPFDMSAYGVNGLSHTNRLLQTACDGSTTIESVSFTGQVLNPLCKSVAH